MATKVSMQYFIDEDGQLLLGDPSWVTCADDDPALLLSRVRVVEDFSKAKEDPK